MHRTGTLDPQQRVVAVGDLVHLALVIGEIARGRRSGVPEAGRLGAVLGTG